MNKFRRESPHVSNRDDRPFESQRDSCLYNLATHSVRSLNPRLHPRSTEERYILGGESFQQILSARNLIVHRSRMVMMARLRNKVLHDGTENKVRPSPKEESNLELTMRSASARHNDRA